MRLEQKIWTNYLPDNCDCNYKKVIKNKERKWVSGANYKGHEYLASSFKLIQESFYLFNYKARKKVSTLYVLNMVNINS